MDSPQCRLPNQRHGVNIAEKGRVVNLQRRPLAHRIASEIGYTPPFVRTTAKGTHPLRARTTGTGLFR